MAMRSVIEVGPRGGQRVGRYMGKDGKIHWIYLGKGGAGVGAGLEHGHAAPDDAPAEEHRAQPAHETHGHVHKDPRIPPVGTTVTGTYKGQEHKVTVTATGYRYEGNGQEYRSLSQLASELADSRQNGFRFFGLHEDAGVDRRRKEPGAAGEAGTKAKRTVALSEAGQQSAQTAARQEAAGPPQRTVALAPGASSTAPAAAAPQAAAAGGPAEVPAAERRPPEVSQPPAARAAGVDEKPARTERQWVDKAPGLPDDTAKAHKGPDGQYTPERLALHEKIIGSFLDDVKPVPEGQKPVAVLMMGGPASGKSTAVKTLMGKDALKDFVNVNPDDVKEQLPEYQQALDASAKNAAAMTHAESSDVAGVVYLRALGDRKNVLLDGTGKDLEKYQKRVAMLKKAGYHVQLLMADVDPQTAHERMVARAEHTGRYIPEKMFQDAHGKIPGNFHPLADQVDEAALLSTDGAKPEAVWTRKGGKDEVHNEERYAAFRDRAGRAPGRAPAAAQGGAGGEGAGAREGAVQPHAGGGGAGGPGRLDGPAGAGGEAGAGGAEEGVAAPATATATEAPQTPAAPPEAPPAAGGTATATARQGGLPPRPGAAPQQGDLLPRERGQLNLTAPEAPQPRRAAAAGDQPSLFGGAPERPPAEHGKQAAEPGKLTPEPGKQAPAPTPQATETGSLSSQAPAVQEQPPAEAPKPAVAAPQAASPTVQGQAPATPPEARGANQPRTTGNEEQRQGNLARPDVAGMEAALKPHAARTAAATDPGEKLKALTAEFAARSEHGRQLAGMEGPEARAALERNRAAMGQINSSIGALRGQGAGEKPAPAAAPAESQTEMAESRGRLSAPGTTGKPRTVVAREGVQRALDGAKRRTDLTAAAHKAASEALAKGDFTAAREALAKGSTERWRKTALEYVDRLEDAASAKASTAAPAGKPEAPAPAGPAESPKAAPPSPEKAAAKATPGEYHRAIAEHAAAHLSAADERARPHVERILEKVGGPAALGENLPSDPARRATALGRWAAHVVEKMGPDLEAAGLQPHAAERLIRHTLERSNWHPEARAALLAHISGERGKTLAPAAQTIGDGAENLAGGAETRAGHVQQAVDLYDADWKALAQKGEVATARVADLVQKAGQADTPEARQHAQRALAEALGPLLELARVQDAYPSFQDRAIQPARDAIAAASTLGRTTPTRDGATTPLFLQGENGRAQRMKARYRLVEAGEVTPSHDPFSFAQNKAYPEGVQEREYHSDESDRNKVIKQAQELTPEFMVNTNPDAVNGPPMVLPSGIVLGGNSRAMSLTRAYENHPEVAEAYRKHLASNAAHFGFTEADVGALKRPMLVRTVETDDQSPEALARLGHQMNAGFTQAMNPAAEQVSLGKQLKPQTLDVLATAMQPDESLPDFLDSASSREFVEALRKDGVFTERNENQYFDRNNKLNEDGKARVARILMGRVVGQADAIRNTPPSLVESVARVVPTLMQADAAGERYSLGQALRTALEGHGALRSWGKQDAAPDAERGEKRGTGGILSSKSDEKHWQRAWDHLERGLLTRASGAHPAATDPAARELVQVLVKRGGPRQIVPVFEEYARLAKEKGGASQTDFFGGSPESAGDLLRRAVQNVETREGEAKVEKAATKAEKEQKAREKIIAEHERAKSAAAPPAPAPPKDPQQAEIEARAEREEADRKAREEQEAKDRAEGMRNQTSFL